MESYELFVHNAGEGQCVEIFHDQIIHVLVVLAENFLTEIEIGCHLTALMVPSEHDYCFREIYFVGEEQNQHLN